MLFRLASIFSDCSRDRLIAESLSRAALFDPGEYNMGINCPNCGCNVAQILTGTDDRRYSICLGCREITPVERRRMIVEESGWLRALSQPRCILFDEAGERTPVPVIAHFKTSRLLLTTDPTGSA
jgi:hypothetical protein